MSQSIGSDDKAISLSKSAPQPGQQKDLYSTESSINISG